MKARVVALTFLLVVLSITLGAQARSVAAAGTSRHQGFERIHLQQSEDIIQNVVMARGVTGSTMKDIQPVGVTKTFPPGTLKFYSVVTVQNAPRGTKISTKWIAVEIKDVPPDLEFGSLELPDIEGSGNLSFSMENLGQPFREGKYRVDVYIDDEQEGSILFSVGGGTDSPKAPSADGSQIEFVGKVNREPDPKQPGALAVDKQGNVYIGEVGQVRIVDANGAFVAKFGSIGDKDGEFGGPAGIAVDNEGNLFIVDKLLNRLQKFDAQRKLVFSVGKKGNMFTSAGDADGEFDQPMSVALDAVGNIYVADAGNNRIQKFDARGKFLTKWGGALGSEDGQFRVPAAVALDSAGNMVIADAGNHRIQKLNSNGKFLAKFGTRGSSNGLFELPAALALDTQGNIYVVDQGNSRVQKFDKDGQYLLQFGGKGSENGQFEKPGNIALDSQGNIYVADAGAKPGDDKNVASVWKFRQVSATGSVPPSSSITITDLAPSSLPPSAATPVPPAPSAPPGVYTTAIQVIPAQPKRGQVVTFKVSFLNTTSSPQRFEWLVKPYAPNAKNPKGETYRKVDVIPVGTFESTSGEGWKITGGGECETYIARVFFADPNDKSKHVEFMQPNKSEGVGVQFQVCP